MSDTVSAATAQTLPRPPESNFYDLASSWPPWAGLCVILFLILFRSVLAGLFSKRVAVTGPGFGVELGAEEQAKKQMAQVTEKPSQPAATTPEKQTTAIDVLKELDDPTINEQEALIAQELERRNVSAHEKEKILLRSLAKSVLAVKCEQIYRDIFGSQLNLLRYMNSIIPRPATRDDLDAYYRNFSDKDPEYAKTYATEQWIEWLVKTNLIVFEQERYKITNLGRTFLQYIIHSSLPNHKDL